MGFLGAFRKVTKAAEEVSRQQIVSPMACFFQAAQTHIRSTNRRKGEPSHGRASNAVLSLLSPHIQANWVAPSMLTYMTADYHNVCILVYIVLYSIPMLKHGDRGAALAQVAAKSSEK